MCRVIVTQLVTHTGKRPAPMYLRVINPSVADSALRGRGPRLAYESGLIHSGETRLP